MDPAASYAADPWTAPSDEAGDGFDESDYVINRAGEREPVNFGRITDRIRDLLGGAYGPRLRAVNATELSQHAIARFKSGMTTAEIDEMIIGLCRALSGQHPDYTALAARLMISNLQKKNQRTFLEVYEHLSRDPKSRIAPGFLALVRKVGETVDEKLDLRRDYMNAGFSAATLIRSYLLRDSSGEVVELPCHMFMRVALTLLCMRPSRQAKYDFEVDPRDGTVEGRTLREEGEPPGGMPVEESILPIRLAEAFQVYDALSLKMLSHASPTIFNAGTIVPQFSSCFQVQVDDDLSSLYTGLHDMAMMSKSAGGVSLTLDRVRAAEAHIRGSGGKSSGITRFIEINNKSQEYANQGGNRPGAFAMYLGPWHADVLEFLEMPLINGPRYEQRRDGRFLKYAIWAPDRFLFALEEELDVQRRVLAGEAVPAETVAAAGDWHLFSPDEAPWLESVYDERGPSNPDGPGGSFSALYDAYVAQGRHRRVVKASTIIRAMIKALGMTGVPYVLAKDAVNRQSNLATPSTVRIGAAEDGTPVVEEVVPGTTVVSSNLCAEVTIPCRAREGRPEETMSSVCNLAALNLAAFVKTDPAEPAGCRVDFAGIIDAASIAANNLDKIIDLNYNPTRGCERSNKHYRAIGIGVMGLADVFLRLGLPYGSREALELDVAMHACIYYGAVHQSVMLAEQYGSFPGYPESAFARGMLQPDLCVADGILPADWETLIGRVTGGLLGPDKWAALRVDVATKGVRNGYQTATMPTATSSNGVGVNETVEPYGSHLQMRKTLAGEFTLLNPHLVRLLQKKGQWSDKVSAWLDVSGGSVQQWDGTGGRPSLTDAERQLYLTAREIDQRILVKHAASRNPFISQSQSMNMYWDSISLQKSVECWLTAWRSGCKTLSYYSHSRPAGSGQQISVKAKLAADAADAEPAAGAAPAADAEEGTACPFVPGDARGCTVCAL